MKIPVVAPLVAALLLAAGIATGSVDAADAPADDESPPSGRYLLMDANGRAVTNADFPGQFQLIAFGYTYCPDICPTTLVEAAAILKQLGDRAERVQPIFITVDPQRDTPQVLATYTAYFHPRIIGLTGSASLIDRAAQNFNARYRKVTEPGAPADRYHVDHSAGMYLLGPDGSYIRKFGYSTPAAEIAERIDALLSETHKADPTWSAPPPR
ncbi:SCO family protein [Thiocapsa roseopersicina]|uniref:Protein SCO1/2 n=1 Tax=Thiocapsa roseopersicina TaxID=1058 RepID=A0A1H2WLU7_THIRO|nr:SCO family protein [Thiocapsa roseopersicina]SDW81446.1 protein SCO1/2 [Thiocapsa roseopersicina]